MGDVDYDSKSQLERIQTGVVSGETLFAVYDLKGGQTGFVGLTDRRVILQDEGIVRKRRSIVSIPYGQIAMLASKDEGRAIRSSSELTIVTTAGREFDLEFRSGDKAERAYAIIIRHLS